MKNRFLRIIILIFIVSVVFYFNGGIEKLLQSQTVEAFGDLIVDFHVPLGDPIFSLFNMKPGDNEGRNVDVTNNGTVSRFVAVKGFRTGGLGDDPKIETELDLVIKEGSNTKFGPAKLSDFFAASSSTNGILLDIFNPADHRTYNFNVIFPTSAGDEFQNKSVVTDFTFGVVTANNLVINEVFYNVDRRHGLNEPKDDDEEDEDEDERRFGIKDKNHHNKKKKTRLKYQWVELYNPTDKDISLKNWRIYNNSGRFATIRANKKIKAGGFAVIAKNASPWRFWFVPRHILRIELGSYFGDGFDIDGDRAILKNPSGKEIDRMSWGTDTSGFTPPAVNPKVDKGHSSERQAPGFDTDAATDWIDRNPPTPGG